MRSPRLRSRLALGALLATVQPLAATPQPDTGTTPIVVRVERGDFGWTEAALGAVAGGGLAIAVGGGVALFRRDAGHEPRRTESNDDA